MGTMEKLSRISKEIDTEFILSKGTIDPQSVVMQHSRAQNSPHQKHDRCNINSRLVSQNTLFMNTGGKSIKRKTRLKKRKTSFTKYESAILKTTFRAGRPSSISEISRGAGVSWVTGKKYTKKLTGKKWLKPAGSSKLEFNYSKLRIKRRKIKK
jgi:hypothetical protein